MSIGAAAKADDWRGPQGLVDAEATARLTFGWLAREPQPKDFGLASGVEPPKPNPHGARWAYRLQTMSFAGMGVSIALAVSFAPIAWAIAALTGLLGLLCGALVWIRGAEAASAAKTHADWTRYHAAITVYAPTHAWKTARANRAFWFNLGGRDAGAEFELECAELMAGLFKTKQIALTRKSDDYGADVMAVTDKGLVVAQCKLSRNTPPKIAQIRELAGTKTYFNATQGLFFSLTKVSETREQAGAFAESCNLQFWDLDAILALTEHLSKDP